MATSTPAHVTPDVLRWARESIGYALEDAAERINVRPAKLARAEEGEAFLTMRQAERAAALYDRALATLFLDRPPAEEPQEAQFRRLPGAPRPPWPPEMQALARRVAQRQAAAVELYEGIEEDPPWPVATEGFRVDVPILASVARQVLGITGEEQSGWRDHSGYAPLRRWIGAVEDLGVLVMQDGTMPVATMRGFAAAHPMVPAIVVNTQDDPRARAWTVVHELGHHVRRALGLPDGPETEQWCDDFAGEVIMPEHWLERVLRRVLDRYAKVDYLEAVDELALTFGVTPRATAVRLARRQLLPEPVTNQVIAQIGDRPPRIKGTGGNYYRTRITRLGPAFTRLVFEAVDNQAVTLSDAAGLLEAKVNNFDALRQTLESRAELE